jgi:hypothetical protein
MSVPAWAQDSGANTPVQQDTPVNANYRAQPDWMPKPDPDKGLVIIFRERRFVGGGVSFKLFYNDKAFPKLKNGRFVHVYLDPGDYQIYSDKKHRKDARLQEIEPGETYYFEASLVTGMWKSSVDLLPTDAETAQARMATLRRPVPRAVPAAAVTPEGKVVDDAVEADSEDSSESAAEAEKPTP